MRDVTFTYEEKAKIVYALNQGNAILALATITDALARARYEKWRAVSSEDR